MRWQPWAVRLLAVADQPRLAPQADGSLVAHWLQNLDIVADGRFYGLRIVRSTDGGSRWHEVHRGRPEGAGRWPHFLTLLPGAANPSGVFLRLVPASDVGPPSAAARGFRAMSLEAGTFGLRSVTLDVAQSVRACDAVPLVIAADGPVAALRSGSHAGDVSVVRLVGNQWTVPAPVYHDGWLPAVCPDNPPALAAAGRQLAVAWFTAVPQPTLRVAFSADGGRADRTDRAGVSC